MNEKPDPHPDHEPYKDLAFDDGDFQQRLRIQETKFGYGVMSMDDVNFTDSVNHPDHDGQDVGGWFRMITGGANRGG
jgi:hypothetical protein